MLLLPAHKKRELIHTIYGVRMHIYMYTWLATQVHPDRHTQHSHRHRQHQWPPSRFPSLAEQDGGPCVRIYLHTCAKLFPPVSGIRHPVCPVAVPGSQPPQLLAPAHVNLRDHSCTAFAGAQTYTQTHRCMCRAGRDSPGSQ